MTLSLILDLFLMFLLRTMIWRVSKIPLTIGASWNLRRGKEATTSHGTQVSIKSYLTSILTNFTDTCYSDDPPVECEDSTWTPADISANMSAVVNLYDSSLVSNTSPSVCPKSSPR